MSKPPASPKSNESDPDSQDRATPDPAEVPQPATQGPDQVKSGDTYRLPIQPVIGLSSSRRQPFG